LNSAINSSASIDDYGTPLTLSFSDLSVTRVGNDGSTVTTLRPMTGTLLPGYLTAIMGGSGAGKSTLLRALRGRLDESETLHGHFSVNGDSTVDMSSPSLQSRVGFVPQDDTLHDDLTVLQNLLLSASWRLDSQVFSLPARLGIVNDILARLKLTKQRNLRVGKGSDTSQIHVSGGQKKRVNIGVELVSDPDVLFLDEPTSGLDSATTKNIITELNLSSKNASITTVAVLHQPSDEVFGMFEYLILLAREGATLYSGPTKDAVSYFQQRGFRRHSIGYANRADFLMDIVEGEIIPDDCEEGGEEGEKWCKDYVPIETPYLWWKEHTGPTVAPVCDDSANSTPLDPSSRTSFSQQFLIFLYRSSLLLWVNSSVVDILLVAGVAVMVAVARIELVKRYGMNLISAKLGNNGLAMGISMIAVVQAIPEFESERLTFLRERAVGLDVTAFVLSKLATSLYVIGITPLVFVIVYASVLHAFTPPPDKEGSLRIPRSVESAAAIMRMYWALVVNTFTASSFASLIALLASDAPEKAMLGGVLMLISMNLASAVNEKAAELSFMNSLNLWLMTIDSGPTEKPLTRIQMVNLALVNSKSAQEAGKTSLDAFESMLPKLKTDETILLASRIKRSSNIVAERSMIVSGLLARAIGFFVLLDAKALALVIAAAYVSIWWAGYLAVVDHTIAAEVTREEKETLNTLTTLLAKFSTKSEGELMTLELQFKDFCRSMGEEGGEQKFDRKLMEVTRSPEAALQAVAAQQTAMKRNQAAAAALLRQGQFQAA
jgi:ABC-type multidrug transport system ATPase subunit